MYGVAVAELGAFRAFVAGGTEAVHRTATGSNRLAHAKNVGATTDDSNVAEHEIIQLCTPCSSWAVAVFNGVC